MSEVISHSIIFRTAVSKQEKENSLNIKLPEIQS